MKLDSDPTCAAAGAADAKGASKSENDDATSAVSDDLELSDDEDSNESSKDAKGGATGNKNDLLHIVQTERLGR